jgi:hypothetical protein
MLVIVGGQRRKGRRKEEKRRKKKICWFENVFWSNIGHFWFNKLILAFMMLDKQAIFKGISLRDVGCSNRCRKNNFNQASFKESPMFNSWQSRFWFNADVTGESNSQFEEHNLPRTAIDVGTTMSIKSIRRNTYQVICGNLDPDSSVTDERDMHS